MTWDFHSTFGRNVLFQNESSKFGITSTLLFDQPLAMVYLNSTLTLLFTESLDASTRLEKKSTPPKLYTRTSSTPAATA